MRELASKKLSLWPRIYNSYSALSWLFGIRWMGQEMFVYTAVISKESAEPSHEEEMEEAGSTRGLRSTKM